jgi:CheY-like chemotaxis protein
MHKLNSILLIDDDTVNNFIVTKNIELAGITKRIHTCLNGKDGIIFLDDCLEKREEHLPDVILLDINMPVMDGWDFLNEFGKYPESVQERVRIYVVSSSVHMADIERSRQYRCVKDFISKPIHKERLLSLVAGH